MLPEILCKKDLYWRKTPHSKGVLTTDNTPDPQLQEEVIMRVFMAGRKYQIRPYVKCDACGELSIKLIAYGEDDNEYTILKTVDVVVESRLIIDNFLP